MVDKAWKARVLTLFPEMFRDRWDNPCRAAPAEGRWSLDLVNIRDHATDRHRTVDDALLVVGRGW